jgi:mono/diheme cytochrome c family protein
MAPTAGDDPVQPYRRRIAPVISALILSTVMAGSAGGNPLYDQYCIACHGPDARGIANLGVDLIGSTFVGESSTDTLVAFLKAGRLVDDPASISGRPMPGFSWVSDAELLEIANFLKSRNVAD